MNKQLHNALITELHETYIQKNTDYGDAFAESIDEFGYIAGIVRMNDKFKRLKSLLLVNQEQQVKTESVKDTLMDLANYCLLTVIHLNEHEQEKQQHEVPNNKGFNFNTCSYRRLNHCTRTFSAGCQFYLSCPFSEFTNTPPTT